MRLNEQITDTNPPNPTEVQFLLKGLIDSATESLSVDLHSNLFESLDQTIEKFFERYYIKPNNIGKLNAISINIKLSLIEAEILNFFLSDTAKIKPFLLVDHAGRGKTTILKYIAHYLYFKEKSLSNKLKPVYLSLRPYETTIPTFSKAIDLHSFLDNLLKERAFPIANRYFLKHSTSILKWINEYYPSEMQGTYSDETIENISKNPSQYLEKLSNDNQSKMLSLIIAILSYYSQNKCPIVLFIDDADNYSIMVQRSVLDYARIKISLGFRVLVALRVSTWNSMESDRRDYEPYVSLQQIDWSLDRLKDFLLLRLKNAQELVRLQDQYQIDMEKKEVVDAFFSLLSHNQTIDFIIQTSNFNLHSLMRKLSLMPQSWHFRDRYLLKEQLSSHVSNSRSKGLSLWNTYNLIFGSYRGSFKSSDDNARSGIINLFCTGEYKHEPYTFFARIHLLARLRDATTEVSAIRIKEIQDEYREIFGCNLRSFTRVFSRALFRLVQSSLVCTLSCRRYKTIKEVEEHIDADSLYISYAGLYYLNCLIFRIDYFFFMKDDIDWPDYCNLSDIEFVKTGMSRIRRHKNALRAIRLLALIEFRMLEEIRNQLNKPGDSYIAKDYVTLFSGQRVGKGSGDISFAKNMLNEYKKYLMWSVPDYEIKFEHEFIAIDNLFDDYENIKRSFQ